MDYDDGSLESKTEEITIEKGFNRTCTWAPVRTYLRINVTVDEFKTNYM